MIQASTLLSEQKFWETINRTIKDSPSLAEQKKLLLNELETFTEEELFGFEYHVRNFKNTAYTADLWAVAFIVMGGCGDDGFSDFRCWLISRGEDVYKKALTDYDSLCDEFEKIPDGDIPAFEEFAYITKEILSKKYNKDFHSEETKYDFSNVTDRPEINITWNENDPDSFKKICPKTFEKWWDNERF